MKVTPTTTVWRKRWFCLRSDHNSLPVPQVWLLTIVLLSVEASVSHLDRETATFVLLNKPPVSFCFDQFSFWFVLYTSCYVLFQHFVLSSRCTVLSEIHACINYIVYCWAIINTGHSYSHCTSTRCKFPELYPVLPSSWTRLISPVFSLVPQWYSWCRRLLWCLCHLRCQSIPLCSKWEGKFGMWEAVVSEWVWLINVLWETLWDCGGWLWHINILWAVVNDCGS